MELIGPIFYIKDLNATVDFFVSLGLQLDDIQDNGFANLIFTDGKKLGLKLATGGREIPGSQTLMLKPEDIDASFNKCKELGVSFIQDLKEEPWGKTFIISDPNGNWIEFIQ